MMLKSEAERRFERGDRERFAISAIFYESFEDYYHIGRFTFFVDSKQFGNWEENTDLAAGARWARTYLEWRESADLYDASDYSGPYLLWRLYGSHMQSNVPRGYQSLREDPPWYDRETYWHYSNRFSLDTIGESATRDAAVTLAIPQPNGTDRIVAYEYGTEEIGDATVDSEEVLQIVEEFAEWVEGLG